MKITMAISKQNNNFKRRERENSYTKIITTEFISASPKFYFKSHSENKS